jgi:zinc transporter ZupT
LLLLPVLSTLAGGWLALRARRYQLVLAFAGAGLLLGTALFDLFPEALQLAVTAQESTRFVVLVAAAAFSAFWVLDAALDRLPGRRAGQPGVRRAMGRVSGGLLILHSFRDGMVIGAAFAASHAAGMIVALGIVVHDIGDGMNTVLLSTAGERATRLDYGLLLADALAPLAGGLLTIWWVQSPANAVVPPLWPALR